MINRVVLVGRMTKDPVLRKTASGTSVVSFTVACDRRVKSEGQPTADFINTVAWNKTAEIVAQYTHKGSLVGVEGRIQTRSYDDQSGKRVYVTEVVADSVQFLEPKGTSTANSYTQNTNAYAQGTNAYAQSTNTYAQNTYAPEDSASQSYQPETAQSMQPETNVSPSYSSDFQSSDTLDIASDDLPF